MRRPCIFWAVVSRYVGRLTKAFLLEEQGRRLRNKA